MRGLLDGEEGANQPDVESSRQRVKRQEGLRGIEGGESGGLKAPCQPDRRGAAAGAQGGQGLPGQRGPAPVRRPYRLRHEQDGQEGHGADEADNCIHRHGVHAQQHPSGGSGAYDVAGVAGDPKPGQPLPTAAWRLLGHVCQRDRPVDGGGHAVNDADDKELLGGMHEPVYEGHGREEGGPQDEPSSSPPAVRENADQRLEDHPRQGGHGDDKAQEGVARPHRGGEDRQKGHLAHLVGGAHREIGGGDAQ